MIIEPPRKPVFELLPQAYAPNPAKNYMFQLLLHAIRSCNPARSLDAGAGTLRNFWMFPGRYVGISHNRGGYFLGLEQPAVKKAIARNGNPEVYLMRLESDFSFLGPMDLCVSTQTIFYTEDPVDVLARLSALVRKGGNLIVDDNVERLDAHVATIADDYEAIEIIYWGRSEYDFKDATLAGARIIELTQGEMNAANDRAAHAHFLLIGRSKKRDHTLTQERPEIVDDRGLYIVKKDIPFLKM